MSDSEDSLVIDLMRNSSDEDDPDASSESEIDVETVDEELGGLNLSTTQPMGIAPVGVEDPSPPAEVRDPRAPYASVEESSPPASTPGEGSSPLSATGEESAPPSAIGEESAPLSLTIGEEPRPTSEQTVLSPAIQDTVPVTLAVRDKESVIPSYRVPKDLIDSEGSEAGGNADPEKKLDSLSDSESDAEGPEGPPSPEESEMDDSNVKNSGGKRRNRDEDDDDDEDYRLEDDDYDLLEENLGVKVKRRRYKRLKRIVDSDDDDDSAQEAAPEEKRRRAESIMRSDSDESNNESSAEDDFIVDDFGQPISNRINAAPEYSDANVQEAREIFGTDFDYGDIPTNEQSEDEEVENSSYSEDDQSEVQSEAGQRRRPKRAKVVQMAKVYEPAILEEVGITDEAQMIRATDIPERYQLRRYPLTKTGPELNIEVKWIYRKAFASPVAPSEEGTVGLPNLSFPAASTVVDGDDWDECDTVASSVTPSVEAEATPAERRNRLLTKIKTIIKLIRDEKFEIPYIYFYHKDLTKPEFNIYDLWKIYLLDQEFGRFYERKSRLLLLFDKMQAYQVAMGEEFLEKNDIRQIVQEDFDLIHASNELEDLHDIQSLFLLYYADDVPKMKEMEKRKKKELAGVADDSGVGEELSDESQNSLRPASSGGTYRTCLRNGVGKILPLIGLSAEQFGENLDSMYAVNLAHQTEMELDEVFQIFTSERFREKQAVRDGVKYMMATHISRDMRVRRVVRNVFHSKAKICVSPTRKGLAEIDENHPIFHLMFLKGKPVKEMDGIDFIELTQAEKDGLINMSIGDYIPDRCGNGISLIEEAKGYFRSESNDEIAEKWEEFRGMIVESAFEKMLYPEMRKELRNKLLEQGRKLIGQRCADRIYNYIKDAPFNVRYEKDTDEGDWNTFGGIKVMGVAYEDHTPAVCVVVNREGVVEKSVVISNVFSSNFRRMTESMSQSKDTDREKLRMLIEETKPHVVVIGGESRGALNLSDEIREVLYSFPEWEINYRLVPVHIIENDVSKVVSRTAASIAEFPGTVEYYRQAVSLGRYLQDPLLELAQLCTRDDDLLSLHLYKYQRHISKEELMRGIELEFINRTCETGVDINDAASHPHRSHSLQFVAGLGYHKSSGLLRKIRQDGRKVENRTELFSKYGIGPLVFKNAAGFLRIKEGLPEEADIDPRDQSRIHPQFYQHALTVSRAALDEDEELVDYTDTELLERVMTEPTCQLNLQKLDLSGYMEDLSLAGYGDLKLLFEDIVRELLQPYAELRKPFHIPAQEELFYILSKETFETVREAKLLTAYMNDAKWRQLSEDTLSAAVPERDAVSGKFFCKFCAAEFRELEDVWRHYDDGACLGEIYAIHIRFGNGITGVIRIDNLSDEPVDQRELLKLIHLRIPLQVRVLRIDLNKFFLECTSKTSDLQNVALMPKRDPYYDEEAERERSKSAPARRIVPPLGGFVRRNVNHPSFKNIPFQEAEAILKDMDQGDCIFRPSTKGLDQLSLTWNVAPGIFQHLSITEHRKPSDYELGTKLVLGDRDFEDLDEIMARFVNPQAAFAREILTYKYYKNENYDEATAAAEYLSQERKKDPNKIHYCLTASRKTPGTFKLSFLLEENMYQEALTIFPEGIFFRNASFQSVEECLSHWKKGFQDKGNKEPEEPNVELDSLSVEK